MPIAERRRFLHAATAAAGTVALPGAHAAAAPRSLLARRLQPGATLALVSPANASYERDPVEFATEALQALGFKVRHGAHLRGRYGQFGGTDAERTADLNAAFADDGIAGILALTGGSGCNRIVDRLDYESIARRPKFFGGFSDLTCLINAIQHKTGLVTFHSPMGSSEWNAFSVASFRAIVIDAEAALLKNPEPERGDNLVARQDRTTVIAPGRAHGRLVGGNLTVLAAMAGSPYLPDCRGAILCLEDVNEYIYRIDRALSTLRLAGAFDGLAGVALGHFTNCKPGDGYGTLTLDEVFDDYFKGLGVPVYGGASFGHIRRKLTVPIGAAAEIDAAACTLRLLAPAVR